ncbi:hypothetical protein DWY36_18640 [Firmicutes bacterium AF25-13AC]|nr:hypothetical protein DWY36_18640 [Firmicutes bacterium AF25-13AC]
MKGYRRNEISAREGIDTCDILINSRTFNIVEMRYQPERALTQLSTIFNIVFSFSVEMRYQPESKALVLVISKMIKEWCERQVPRKALGDSHLKNAHIGACPRQK